MLTVRDIMQADVTTASTDMTVRQLSRHLADAEVTGMPVVTRSGALVGVVSATDVVRFAAEQAGVTVAHTGVGTSPLVRDPDVDDDDPEEDDPFGFFLPEDSPAGRRLELEGVAEERFDTAMVEDIMTPVTFTVEPDMTVPELADFLLRGRIHRAVVVEDGRLEGIVTSTDVLRAVSRGRVGA